MVTARGDGVGVEAERSVWRQRSFALMCVRRGLCACLGELLFYQLQ
jgi:hypothetical protein